MQKTKTRLYPDCSCCGERLEKKNEILPGLLQCPKCKNEHYVDVSYDQKVMSLLSDADIKKNASQFNDAYDMYEAIAKDHLGLSEAHFGMFLCSYGIIYTETDGIERSMPKIHHYIEDKPTENRHFLKSIEVTKDKYRKKHLRDEGAVIDQIWNDSKPALKKAEKTKVKKVIPVELPAEELAESPLIQRRGIRIPEGYQLNPILENKIKNAEVIYLKAGKFNRANKLFEEVLEVDPCAKRAIWGKILCRLQVNDIELLGFNTKINNVFPLFEELMGCLSKADENIYLKTFEEYLFRKLNSVGIFDEELYEYIIEWKKKGEQKTFANQLYATIKKLLEEDKKTEIAWLYPALAQATKYNQVDDKKLYVSKYIEIAQDLNLLELYKDALKLSETVLGVDKKNQDALLIQLCSTYKVPQLSDLHTVLKDLKQIKVFEELIDSGYQKLDLFDELKLAAIDLIDQKSYKQAIALINLYIEKLPKKEEDALAEALLEFSNDLIYIEKFKEAEDYVDMLIEKRPLLPAAHWNKLKLKLKANTDFDVLMLSKKDLMEYPDFAKTINSTSNPEDYIKFYELHDQLRQPVPESRKFKKMARKHYYELEEQCGNTGIQDFVATKVPKMKKQIDILVKDEQARVTNLFMRSIIVVILIGFAFMTSNLKSFFDYSLSNNGTHVAWYFWLFLKDLSGYIVIGAFVLLFIIESFIEGKGFFKGLLRGIGLGLAFAALGLIAGAGIPWALHNYLGSTLYGVSPLILSGALFAIVLIASVFILRSFHMRLTDVTSNKKTARASWINMIILILLILGGLVGTYFIG